jgi:hypothetical protein
MKVTEEESGHAKLIVWQKAMDLVSLGSTAELNTQLEIARRQKFLSDARYTGLVSLLDEVGRMLSALIVSLNAKR